MRKTLFLLVLPLLFVPAISFASTLTTNQVNSIIMLLEAFGVDAATISSVQLALAPQPQSQSAPTSQPTQTEPTSQPNPTSSSDTQVATNSSTNQDTQTEATPAVPPLNFTSAPAWEVWNNGNGFRLVWKTNKAATSKIYVCLGGSSTLIHLDPRCSPGADPTNTWGNLADWERGFGEGLTSVSVVLIVKDQANPKEQLFYQAHSIGFDAATGKIHVSREDPIQSSD